MNQALLWQQAKAPAPHAVLNLTWFLPRPPVWIVYLASDRSGAPPGQTGTEADLLELNLLRRSWSAGLWNRFFSNWQGVQIRLQIPVALRPTFGYPQPVLNLMDPCSCSRCPGR